MSELFSNERIIDYFITFECNAKKIMLPDEVIEKLTQSKSDSERHLTIEIEYEYKKLISLPKKHYKDCYELSIESIWKFLPKEEAYFSQQSDSFFSLIFTSASLNHYYCFFYKIYLPIDRSDQLYIDNPILNSLDINVYLPKYLCFTSVNPFFISFRNLLCEIYNQSIINKGKCFKIENILNTILYRLYLPKYQTTQLLFCLGENVYSFSKSPFRSEVGIRILFSYIQIKHIVMIIIAVLMNSVIIIRHSNMEIISPIINSLFELIFPLPESYSLIGNVTPDNIDLLSFEERIIAGIYSKDFDEEFIGIPNHSNYIVVDLDQGQSRLLMEHNDNLKDKDIIPIQRISNLVNELYKVADIYQYKYYEPVSDNNTNSNSNTDLLSYFQNENVDWIPQERTLSRGKSIGKISPDKKSILEERVIENKIRALFFDFIIGLFEKYDEKAYYTIDTETQDKNFDVEGFIENSNSDIHPFLEAIHSNQCFDAFFQNINHIVDMKHKTELKLKDPLYKDFQIKINSLILEKGLLKDFDYVYRIFMSGLEKKRNKKSYNGLFKSSIYHTISISSPPYENLPYKQQNIFVDPLNELLLKHETASEFYKIPIEFNILNAKQEDQKHFDLLIKCTYDVSKVKGFFKGDVALVQGSSIINHPLFPTIAHFKSITEQNEDLLTKMFGILSNKTKSYVKKIEIKTQKSKQQVINWAFSKQSNITKDNYLKSFNVFTQNLTKEGNESKISNKFHMNFGINTIYTISFCDYCSKPNNLWDTRKEYEYSKTRKKTITKCKFCSQSFVPFFYIIDDEKPGYVLKNMSLYKKKSIVRVEYMCYDHMVEIYKDIESTKEDKKNIAELYYNICLLLGEVRCILNKGHFLLETIDDFVNRNSNDNGNSNGENNKKASCPLTKSCFSSNIGNEFIRIISKKKESKNTKGCLVGLNKNGNRNKPTIKQNKNEIKTMNFKFDIREIINEQGYIQMQKNFQLQTINSTISRNYKPNLTEQSKANRMKY